MTESEDAASGTTVAQTKTSTESEKVHTIILSVIGSCGYRINTSNNTRDSAAITSKYYKGKIESFGAVLELKYEKV